MTNKPSETILNRAKLLQKFNPALDQTSAIAAAEAEQIHAGKVMNRARSIRAETPAITFVTAISMAQREIGTE